MEHYLKLPDGMVVTPKETSVPLQGRMLGLRAEICFYYDTSTMLLGTIVRDDRDEPFLTIFRLDDGRYIEACECQYSDLAPGTLAARAARNQQPKSGAVAILVVH